MTAPAVHRPWPCYQRYVRCQHGHVFRTRAAKFHVGFRQVTGHDFLECLECEPHTFFFIHYVAHPSPMGTCYAISRDSFREWERAEETPDTPELLFRLRDPNGHSYNPTWRPPG